ncbi:unnamed protein product [Chondrus crispus]|uniref:Uncharacterized protein n=1 Tax=Chondrus crispus TaxID=2769 RepID=R7QNQ9_CHOCR|nr:unnamed protein product [Chondrus crispus]CDF38995.1 unnamed protein product [Chondrus crispus]|eukprot:XP_005718900.1 unnamed protein product [Chondrus crispus]
MALISPSPVRAVPPRTIFDEEREMNERAKKEFENARNDALRAGFEAVHKAREQLDDLQALIEDENWGGVRQFTRLFNNSVEREGMEAIASKLPEKSDRMAALEVARGMTSSLIQIDRCALQKDRTKAILGVDEVRKAISRFESFKP